MVKQNPIRDGLGSIKINETFEVTLGKQTFPVTRKKLRGWLILEEIRSNIINAADLGDEDGFANHIFSFISAAFDISTEELENLPWYEIAEAYIQIYSANLPSHDFAIFRGKGKDREKIPWDYEGRTWYVWLHLLANNYGYSIEYIADMDIDDAIGLSQESLVEDQMDREKQWVMAEIAYSYDKDTKKTKFHPLTRPDWMADEVVAKEVKVLKIPKSFMPVGNVIGWKDGKAVEVSRSD